MLVGIVVNMLFILEKSMTPQFQLETQKVTMTNKPVYRRRLQCFLNSSNTAQQRRVECSGDKGQCGLHRQ